MQILHYIKVLVILFNNIKHIVFSFEVLNLKHFWFNLHFSPSWLVDLVEVIFRLRKKIFPALIELFFPVSFHLREIARKRKLPQSFSPASHKNFINIGLAYVKTTLILELSQQFDGAGCHRSNLNYEPLLNRFNWLAYLTRCSEQKFKFLHEKKLSKGASNAVS